MQAICPPISDIGPNDYSPSPTGDHFANVDEDPHDSDSTILSTFGSSREVWAIDVSAIPAGSVVTGVTIRSVQKESTAGANTYRVGFIITGTDYFQPNHVLGAGSAYVQADDAVPVDPSDGLFWETKERLARCYLVHEQISQAGGLPRPRLTECVVIADYLPPPERPTGTGAAVVGSAAGSAVGPSGTAQGLAPTVTAAAMAVPDAVAVAMAGSATAAAVAAAGTAVAVARGSAVADPGKPTATGTPVGPTATAVAVVPDASAAAVVGSGEGA